MVQQKTSKWSKTKSTRPNNVTAFRPRSTPAVPKDKEKAQAAPALPDYFDYLPFADLAGTEEKNDGRKRMQTLVEADGTFQPVRWYNLNILEGAIVASEQARIMVMELVTAVVKQQADMEREIQARVDREVMAALRKAGLMGEDVPEAETVMDATEANDE